MHTNADNVLIIDPIVDYTIQLIGKTLKKNSQMHNLEGLKDEKEVSVKFITYLRHYRFRIDQFLQHDVEEFCLEDGRWTSIPMSPQTRIRISREIERLDLIIYTYENFDKQNK